MKNTLMCVWLSILFRPAMEVDATQLTANTEQAADFLGTPPPGRTTMPLSYSRRVVPSIQVRIAWVGCGRLVRIFGHRWNREMSLS